MCQTTGLNPGEVMFYTLLYQNGGQGYLPDGSRTDLDGQPALDAFTQWTKFFTDYGLPLYYNPFNRFRTGEMPYFIANLTMCNFLSEVAPEINGLWEMCPIPGTIAENGGVNRATASWGTGCILLSSSKEQRDAFEFMKWWVSASTQKNYGITLENVMGPLARYITANREAFEGIPWIPKQAEVIKDQWQWANDMIQPPGNYIFYRNVNFAFRRVTYYYENERETLNRYNREINAELLRKRREFGLD